MTRRHKLWFGTAVLFTLGNLAGAVYAAALGEQIHCGIHVALTLAGAFWAWQISVRAARVEQPSQVPTDARLEQLQQAVDAVALEVERVGEAQRFRDKLQSERVEPRR